MFALGNSSGAAIQWDQQNEMAILTMINAMLPATIVLSVNIPRHRMASLPGLRRISKSGAAYSINAPSNILLNVGGVDRHETLANRKVNMINH